MNARRQRRVGDIHQLEVAVTNAQRREGDRATLEVDRERIARLRKRSAHAEGLAVGRGARRVFDRETRVFVDETRRSRAEVERLVSLMNGDLHAAQLDDGVVRELGFEHGLDDVEALAERRHARRDRTLTGAVRTRRCARRSRRRRDRRRPRCVRLRGRLGDRSEVGEQRFGRELLEEHALARAHHVEMERSHRHVGIAAAELDRPCVDGETTFDARQSDGLRSESDRGIGRLELEGEAVEREIGSATGGRVVGRGCREPRTQCGELVRHLVWSADELHLSAVNPNATRRSALDDHLVEVDARVRQVGELHVNAAEACSLPSRKDRVDAHFGAVARSGALHAAANDRTERSSGGGEQEPRHEQSDLPTSLQHEKPRGVTKRWCLA
jgi:hypothetical protein